MLAYLLLKLALLLSVLLPVCNVLNLVGIR